MAPVRQITAHAIIRYMERVRGVDYSEARVMCAIERGLASPARVTDGHLLSYLRRNGLLDTLQASQDVARAIDDGEVRDLGDGTYIASVVPSDWDVPEPRAREHRDIKPWEGWLRGRFRRILQYEARYEEETERQEKPRKRR